MPRLRARLRALAGGATVPIRFDACVWAAGFRFPSLPRQAGLAVNDAGQVLTDAHLRSISHPRVHAAGDVAAPPPGVAMPMGCKSALPSGAQVGENLARELAGLEPLPFAYALRFRLCIGERRTHPRASARRLPAVAAPRAPAPSR